MSKVLYKLLPKKNNISESKRKKKKSVRTKRRKVNRQRNKRTVSETIKLLSPQNTNNELISTENFIIWFLPRGKSFFFFLLVSIWRILLNSHGSLNARTRYKVCDSSFIRVGDKFLFYQLKSSQNSFHIVFWRKYWVLILWIGIFTSTSECGENFQFSSLTNYSKWNVKKKVIIESNGEQYETVTIVLFLFFVLVSLIFLPHDILLIIHSFHGLKSPKCTYIFLLSRNDWQKSETEDSSKWIIDRESKLRSFWPVQK